jgi:glycosyltransferase involved in cell wall biosynthesis
MRIYELCDRGVTHLCVNKLIAVSSDIEKVLCVKYGAQRVIRIHNGIDLEVLGKSRARDEVRRELGVDSKCLLIGTVGRLTAVKGHEYLLKTAQLMLQKRRNVKFVIVGDGPLKVELQSLAAQLGITENVAFLGHQDDACALMEAMDLFVLPSLHEGIPMVILEAMALGRPVVASRVGGIPEVITDTVRAARVCWGSCRDRTGMSETAGDHNLAERYGQAGRARVEQQFSSVVMGGKVANLYRQLVGNSRCMQVVK